MHSNCGANGQNMQGKGSMGWKIVSFEITIIIIALGIPYGRLGEINRGSS